MKEKKKMPFAGWMVIFGPVSLLLAFIFLVLGDLLKWIPSGINKGVMFGVKEVAELYLKGFTFDFTSEWSVLCFGIIIVTVISLITSVILKIVRKKGILNILIALFFAIGFLFISYLVVLAVRLKQADSGTSLAYGIIFVSLMFDLVSLFLLLLGKGSLCKEEFLNKNNKHSLSDDEIRAIVRSEVDAYEEGKYQDNLSKDYVISLIKEEMVSHIQNYHKMVEEKPTEEVAPEVETKEVPLETNPFRSFSNRRRASFETKIKGSDYDLRHKYYDLRDHIRSYGVKNRISIPGDTFSAHRKKYAFMTVSGKHLKLYLALEPDAYRDSPIPVERATTKKFEDLPCLLKIRSDLSFRRAIKLIDDLLIKEGFEREDKPIKNTQNINEEEN